jgi:hypothetical protein
MTHDHIESRLQQRLRLTESQLDEVTCRKLRQIRGEAMAEESRWFAEYRRPAIAGFIGLLMTAALLSPLQSYWTGQAQDITATSEPIEVLMEDPSFYIWLEESGQLVADR